MTILVLDVMPCQLVIIFTSQRQQMPSSLTGEFWTSAVINVCGLVEESSVYDVTAALRNFEFISLQPSCDW
jgi:hypothetical protein